MAPPLDDVIGEYTWANEIEALTVAVVRGRAIDDIVRVYGGDPAEPVGDYTFAEADTLRGDPEHVDFHLQLSTRGAHVVAVENDGYSGNFPEIARRCSAGGGTFFSVYWNVDAYGMLTHAVDGVVVARFESLYPLQPRRHPHEIRPEWAIGPEIHPDSAWAACFALLERRTGLRFDPGWLGEKVPTYRIPDPDWMFRDVPGADQP